jgi:SOS-response transcriptional repressor LexA
MNEPLSPGQQKVYDFIHDHIYEHGYFPTYKQIRAFIKVGSMNAIQDVIKALERKGYIGRVKDPSHCNTYTLVDAMPHLRVRRLQRYIRAHRVATAYPADPAIQQEYIAAFNALKAGDID